LLAMINICCTYGNQHCLLFNRNKSVCSKFGTKRSSNTVALLLDNSCLQWVGSFKYLGVIISGASLAVDCCFIKRKFYAAYNSISGGCKFANELVKLHLIKSYCLPLLMFVLKLMTCLNINKGFKCLLERLLYRRYLNFSAGNLLVKCNIAVMSCLLTYCMIYLDGSFFQ
jgi:hypothetical protein